MSIVDEKLARATKSLLCEEAFYGLFLMMLNKRWESGIPTMAVMKETINFYLLLNPQFFEGLKDDWRRGLLKHELGHICFFHLERWDSFENKKVANIAADLEVNQYIRETDLPSFEMSRDQYKELYDLVQTGLKMKLIDGSFTREQYIKANYKIPPRGVYLKDYSELNLDPKAGLKYYYDKLMEAKDKCPGDSGYCPALSELLGDMDKDIPVVCDHDWKDFEGLSEAEQKLMHKQIDTILKEVAESLKNRGLVPGELAGYIDGLDFKEPPKFNWRGYLRRFTGGSQRVDVLRTRMKPNLRYPHSPGRRLKPKAHILIGVDTSGSVCDDELKEFFHEVYHMQKMGSEVTIVQFDAAISNIQKYRKGLEDKIKVFGRGGTSFDPIFDYSREHRRDFSCMIIFTDGEAPAPSGKLSIPVLWCHSSKSSINESLPGQRIKLEL